MATAITFEEFKKRSLKVEGAMAWLSAYKNKLLASIGIRFILYIMKKTEQDTNLKTWDRETSEKIFPLLKNFSNMYQEGLPVLLTLKFPFITKKDKARLIHYSEFLEDVIESLEIGLDHQTASQIENASKGINPATDLPPWRDVIEQI